jgi:hypothetical protein
VVVEEKNCKLNALTSLLPLGDRLGGEVQRWMVFFEVQSLYIEELHGCRGHYRLLTVRMDACLAH